MTSVIPTMAPVIPAWQLQQNSAESDSVESRAEMNNCAELSDENNCENSNDTKPSLTTFPETSDDQTTDTVTDELEITHVKDKLEITQPGTIQVDVLRFVSNVSHMSVKTLPAPFLCECDSKNSCQELG